MKYVKRLRKKLYTCENCSNCEYKNQCIKGNNCKTPLEERTKNLQVAKTFMKQRQADLERILSEEGILYRMNRSIQAFEDAWLSAPFFT